MNYYYLNPKPEKRLRKILRRYGMIYQKSTDRYVFDDWNQGNANKIKQICTENNIEVIMYWGNDDN